MVSMTWLFMLWACLGIVGFVVGAIVNIQQLLDGGWKKFWHAVGWFLVVTWVLAIPCYIMVNWHPADTPIPAKIQPPSPERVEAESANAQKPDTGSTSISQSKPLPPAYVPVPAAQPTPLPLQKRVFSPSEVFFCPDCGKAYSSDGLRDYVECTSCGHTVMLQPDLKATVFRCVQCNSLLKTSYKPPYTGTLRVPTVFDYFCPFCNKKLWFRYPTAH
jgi:DNA-directed RNA polymerase subunit RPC12/RpoP